MKQWNEIENRKYFYLADLNETTNDNDEDVILHKFTKLKLEYVESNEMMFVVEDGQHKGFDLYFYKNRDKPEDLLTEAEYQLVKNDVSVYWKTEFEKIKQCPQRQDATLDQLEDLYKVAVRLGFYDAADAIKNNFFNK